VFSTALTLLLNRRKTSRSHQLACLAHSSMLLGAGVIYLRDQLPEPLVFILCNLAFQASMFSSWLSIMYFHQLQHSHRHLRYLAWFVLLADASAMILFPQILFQYRFRMLAVLPLYLLLFGMMAGSVGAFTATTGHSRRQSVFIWVGSGLQLRFSVWSMRCIFILHSPLGRT
jgi:peptidoglycan/LPS O-acetylase OafA/YrhL